VLPLDIGSTLPLLGLLLQAGRPCYRPAAATAAAAAAAAAAALRAAQLVIAFYMNAAAMGEFTKEEFMVGMTRLQCGGLDALKSKLPSLRNMLNNEERFKEVYQYAYLFCREVGGDVVDRWCYVCQLPLLTSTTWVLMNQLIDLPEYGGGTAAEGAEVCAAGDGGGHVAAAAVRQARLAAAG
jgi:hypothetical protein